jgi:nitrogen fixation protein FixH
MSARTGFRFTGRLALMLLAAFFGLVFLVNGVFVYLATDSFRGLDTADAYRKGLAYNRTLERADAQRALGWRVELGLDGAWPVLRLADATGTPLNGLSVTGTARRPVDERADRTLAFVWSGDGSYRADVALPERGQWNLRVEVARDGGPPFLIEQRLWFN